MDVPRTMPRNRRFAVEDPKLRRNLERVLTAFCIHAPDIGYCQGFNFLAGGALLYLDEEDAFWLLFFAVLCKVNQLLIEILILQNKYSLLLKLINY